MISGGRPLLPEILGQTEPDGAKSPIFYRAAGSDEKAVRLSVCLANACIMTKRKKDLSRFLYHTKYHLA